MVSMDSPPHKGGMGRHVGCLMSGLRKDGLRVTLFDRTHRPLASCGGNIGFSAGLPLALRPWIRKERISLLHVHTGPGGVFLPRPPLPLLVTANHTYAAQSRLPEQGWKRIFIPWERATYRAARMIVCISADTAGSVIRDYGIDPARVRTVPCGFDLGPWIASDQPDDSRDPRSCVFVGRPQTRKGWDLLLHAWEQVRTRAPDAVLHVVGFRHEPVAGMSFHGRLSDDDLRLLLGRSRLLVSPSRLEGFGLAAAEAIACGTPVVGTDVPGLRTVVGHGSGILTVPEAGVIADALVRALTDNALWQTMRAACRVLRPSFGIQAEVAAYRPLYDEVYSRPSCSNA